MIKRNISILALSIAVALTAFYLILMAPPFGNHSYVMANVNLKRTIPEPVDDTAFGNLFTETYVSDTLPHYQYVRITDSIKRAQEPARLDNESTSEGGISLGCLGVAIIPDPRYRGHQNTVWNDPLFRRMEDSMRALTGFYRHVRDKDSLKYEAAQRALLEQHINSRLQEVTEAQNNTVPPGQQYYVTLGGYSLDMNTRFFVKNGTYHLAYEKWGPVQRIGDDSVQTGHYEQKQIPVRYSASEKKIFIPVSALQYRLVKTGLNVLMLVLLFTAAYFFIGIPVQIIISISKGKAFTVENIRRFNIIAYLQFGLILAGILIPYLLRLLFYHKIPAEFTQTSLLETFISNFYMLLLAAVVFVVGKAFRRGYKLQQEHDLTI